MAGCPPMVTVTGSTGAGGVAEPSRPSVPEGLVWPSPVSYSVMVFPILTAFPAPFSEPSWFSATAGPVPE